MATVNLTINGRNITAESGQRDRAFPGYRIPMETD